MIHRQTHPVPTRENGFSMIELMVAVTIGLILLAGIASIMVSSKRTYNVQDSLARLQENARIAMLVMTRDLRNAGYIGCNTNTESITNVLKGGASSFDYNLGVLFQGSESGGNFFPTNTPVSTALGSTVPRSGTDLFMVRGAEADGSFSLEGKMNTAAASLKVSENSGISEGEILILSDCATTDIFQATGNTGSGGFDNIGHSVNSSGNETPGNDFYDGGQKLSKAYGSDATLMRFKSTIYYIGKGASGEPALFRRRVTTSGIFTDEELVEGIESLQVLYGEDTAGSDRIPDSYVKAGNVADWDSVVAVRFGIIARALSNLQTSDRKTANKASDTKALDVDGDGEDDFLGTETTTTTTETGQTVSDRLYDRRMFRTTVILRNFVNKAASS